MSNLFQITQEYRHLAELLNESGGEITPEIELALAINKQNLENKAVNYALLVKDNEYTIANVEAEEERLAAMKKSIKAANDRLKLTILSAMDQFQVEEIKGTTFKLSIRKSKAVIIEDETLIPKFYKEEVPATYKIPKKDIGDALKSGVSVPGAKLITNKSLIIK